MFGFSIDATKTKLPSIREFTRVNTRYLPKWEFTRVFTFWVFTRRPSLYTKQERRLNSFHMRCLRSILGISWRDHVTNETVLHTAQLPSITALVKQRRLRWLGHVHRMDHARLPRRLLIGEIANAKRPIGRPLLRWKDCVKRDMHAFDIPLAEWEELAAERLSWRRTVSEGIGKHDEAWLNQLAAKRAKRRAYNPTRSGARFTCCKCGRVVYSRIGLYSHERCCKVTPRDAA